MTVRELIAELQKLTEEEKDLPAVVYDTEYGDFTISTVEIHKPQGTDPRFQHEPFVLLY